MGSLSLLQEIFPTQRSNPGLPHCRWILYQRSHKGSPAGMGFDFKCDFIPPTILLSFSGGSDGKESACNAGDLGLISGLGRSPGEGKSCPLQYSGPENFLDCIVHGVTKSQTRLSDFRSHLWARPSTEWASQVALVVKNPPANAGDIRDASSIPRWGRSPEVGNGKPL